ncbi:methylated-DNA-[protein]-cysteine S-methyltransferase [Gillisia sp. Hel_I_86]|uniref:methylated-DNA--[protein]-cysteine S-methyltransferase n=1 Tax=Gillisia sp. Hel_I_86 TaxID=1249981 RepID=UPI0011998B8F|nr:methylated-DNA--[protein]-cysteine S-methyltransferase [Gillisia sp. Hel_I_86]TVZ26392.1 methylated-DNA-[protein]-cysteine S-methyltransferase [Gillisia sp. Hel_I_86]
MTTLLKTPLGIAEVSGDELGISKIEILDQEEFQQEEVPKELETAVDQLKGYFSGELKNFTLKMNPAGTNFQKQVWQALNKIPYGETRSYLELSKELGNVKAIRAVAAANGKNPLWIVIPCHRVIGSDGSLTGYAGGLWRKKWLLDFENPPLQQELF